MKGCGTRGGGAADVNAPGINRYPVARICAVATEIGGESQRCRPRLIWIEDGHKAISPAASESGSLGRNEPRSAHGLPGDVDLASSFIQRNSLRYIVSDAPKESGVGNGLFVGFIHHHKRIGCRSVRVRQSGLEG